MAEAPEGYTGYLRMTLERRRTETALRESFGTGAFKLSRPIAADASAGQLLLYVMNPGGGYVDGDRYRLEATLGPGAELALTSQSATKVYRTPKKAVLSESELRLAAGSLLEWLPDPVIAYENAVYVQKTRIELEPGACLVLADAWTPGWSPSGEPFLYERIDATTELYIAGKLRMLDRLRLRPADGMDGIGGMEGFSHYGSLLVIHDKATEDAVQELNAELEERLAGEPVRFGLTLLAVPGFVMRALGAGTEPLQRLTAACHDAVRERWLGKPPLRIRK